MEIKLLKQDMEEEEETWGKAAKCSFKPTQFKMLSRFTIFNRLPKDTYFQICPELSGLNTLVYLIPTFWNLHSFPSTPSYQNLPR